MKTQASILLFLTVFSHACALAAERDFPRPDTLYYNVSDYGARGDGTTDDLPALTRLFEKVSALGVPAKVSFTPGCVYRIGPHTEDLYGRILLNRARHLVVEGNGCTLLIHPSSRAFAIYRSVDITIRNFQLDYSPLPYTQGRVTKVDPDHFYLEFRTDEGYPQPHAGDESYYLGGKMVDCITADGETRKFYQGHSWVQSVTSLGHNTYGVKYALRNQAQLRPGDFFCMKIAYPEARLLRNEDSGNMHEKGEFIYSNSANIAGQQSDSVVLENITSYAAPLMTFVLKGCSHLRIRNCSVRAHSDRIVAGCSDGIHLKCNESQPVIENCHIERTMDDAIHIKISGDAVQEVLAPDKFRIAHMDIAWDNTNLGAQKEVILFNPETRTQLGAGRIIGYQAINYREGIVTLDKEIPGIDTSTRLYLQSREEAIISGCSFGTQLQRAILTHQATRVSGCSIVDNGKGFELGLMSGGIEGPPTQRLIVEDCFFQNLSDVGLEVSCPSRDYDQKGKPQLFVRRCTFDLPAHVPIVRVSHSNGMSFTGNTILYSGDRPAATALFRLDRTPLLRNRNNHYVKRKSCDAPGQGTGRE